MKSRLLCYILVFLSCSAALAQSLPLEGEEYVYGQKVAPQGLDNYLFTTYYYSGKKTYNLRDLTLSTSPTAVEAIKVNPSGTSYAVLYKKGGKSFVTVYDLWKVNKVLHEFKELTNASSLCYSPDAAILAISNDDGIHLYDSRTYEEQYSIPLSEVASAMFISDNNYYLAASFGNRLIVWNLEDKTVRKEYEFETNVNDFSFSRDNSMLAILTADGVLTTYDTRMFFIVQSFESMGNAIHCSWHPDGKYISVVTGDARIAVQNVMDSEERNYIESKQGGVTDARFLQDGKKQTFLTYNTTNSVNYKLVSALAPNYTKLLADELNTRMNEWMKMMPGESLEEYKLRVNDETRAAQIRLFEEEIATRMADNLVQASEVTLGSYNSETNMLAVNFNTMPSIYLDVPSAEIGSFADPGNLDFRNAKYGLTKTDKFELIYADVYNKASGKVYVFNNLERQSLDYLKSDDNFVPLDLVLQSEMEEMKLQEIKEKVVSLAKKKNTISDHTKIKVNAKVQTDYDANGKKILNYKIDFGYEVLKQYSSSEDFAPGKYKAEDSGAASSMLSIIKTAFENEFSQYVQQGKKLQVDITGMADALPINGKIAYDGCYGDLVNEPVYKNGELGTVTVTKSGGVTENEQLAYLRAVGVKKYIGENITALNGMNISYRHYVEITSGKGGEYRRINVSFTFVDAF